MNQLADALEAAGFSPDDITKLRSRPVVLGQIKDVLLGLSEVTITKHLIDLFADPWVPDGWKVVEHRRGDKEFLFDPSKVVLYLDDGQKDGKVIKGHELRKKLADQPVFNANLLDWYLAHPNLIPEEWKGRAVFFWGTIYRDSGGDLCVRCLVWGGGEWLWRCGWLGDDWGDGLPAASRK
jgi:hypothetical protein